MNYSINIIGSSGRSIPNCITKIHDVNKNIDINENIKIIFANNEFHYRRDIIGYIVAHLKIWKLEFDKFCIIIDERVELCDDFGKKLNNILESLDENRYDMLIIGSGEWSECFESDEITFVPDYVNEHDMLGYVLTERGADSLLNMIGQHGFTKLMHEQINDLVKNNEFTVIETYNNLISYDKNTLNIYQEDNKEIKLFEGYKFYSCLDYYGHDVICLEDKSIDELKRLCDYNDNYVAFNTMGWIKYKQEPIEKFAYLYGSKNKADGIYVRDMEPIILKKIEMLTRSKTTRSNLTFTITTCKRYNLFKQTMDAFLLNCKDLEIIDEWICIDDNSSDSDRQLMRDRYPFFKFFMKGVGNKGHPRSMNILWDLVNTDYVIHFEDDWNTNRTFKIEPFLDYLKTAEAKQLILRKLPRGKNHIFINEINGDDVYKYKYNGNHCDKPNTNRQYDKDNGHNLPLYHPEKYDWWPGFTLNPSIFNLAYLKKYVGYFSETINLDLFEYDFATRCFLNNVQINYVNLEIEHTGWKSMGVESAYSLNDTKRSYD